MIVAAPQSEGPGFDDWKQCSWAGIEKRDYDPVRGANGEYGLELQMHRAMTPQALDDPAKVVAFPPSANGNGNGNVTSRKKASAPDPTQPPPPAAPPPPTFTELLATTLEAIKEGNTDVEMEGRAELKGRFRATDQQIERRLIELHIDKNVQKENRKGEGVDLSKVQQLRYRMPGWLIRGDVSLLYGPYGTGKTTLALAEALALADGSPFLDRDEPCEPGNSLFIATDSGAPALKKALSDLGVDPATDPRFSGPDQRIWVWAHAPEQGHEAWVCTIRGIIKLLKFIEEKSIAYVAIDSAKSVSSGAGWSYTDNESVKGVLRYMREGVAEPTGAVIKILSHDGTEKGSHSGAKAWGEEPSMVVALTPVVEDGRHVGVQAEFRKDRAALIDPRRTVRYSMDDGALSLLPGTEVVGNCSEAILSILWDARMSGVEMVSTAGLVDEAMRRFGKTSKTVKNTLCGLVTHRPQRVVKLRRGLYGLSPGEIQRRGTPPSPYREDFPSDLSAGEGSAKVPTQSPGTNPGPSQSPDQSPGIFSGTSIKVSHRESFREDPPKKGRGGSQAQDSLSPRANPGSGTRPPDRVIEPLRALRQADPKALPAQLANRLAQHGINATGKAVKGWIAWIDAQGSA